MRLSILVNLRYYIIQKLVWFKSYADLKKNHDLRQNLTLIAIRERDFDREHYFLQKTVFESDLS